MRRSVQSVLLYEAHRCVASKLPALRPFQRKLAFFDQANALLDSLTFIQAHQKKEVMWRTATSKEILHPEVAWKRMRLIERELAKLREKIKPHYMAGRSHNDACEILVQELYEAVAKGEPTLSEEQARTRPLNWEHAHNNVMLTFRIYFRGDELDPTFPVPQPPRKIVVPAEKPSYGAMKPHYIAVPGGVSDMKENAGHLEEEKETEEAVTVPATTVAANESTKVAISCPVENRRKILAEVREHLELLKEFEGIIPDDDIKKRKCELFLALPQAPPPSGPPPKKSKLETVETI